MADTPRKSDSAAPSTPAPAASMDALMGVSTAWMQAVADLNAEVAGFVAERIKEDVKTQHEMLHCKTIVDVQRIQARFIRKAVDQYQAETSMLVEMGTRAFAPKDPGD